MQNRLGSLAADVIATYEVKVGKRGSPVDEPVHNPVCILGTQYIETQRTGPMGGRYTKITGPLLRTMT